MLNAASQAGRSLRGSATRFWLWWLALTLLALALVGTAIESLADRHRLASAELSAVDLSLTLARSLPDAEALLQGKRPDAPQLAALNMLLQAQRLVVQRPWPTVLPALVEQTLQSKETTREEV